MEVIDAPQRTRKVGTLQQAAALIKDGDTLAFGGIHSHNGPMALIREIIRQGTKSLKLIANVSAGMPADLLVGAGCVDTLTVCYVGLEHLGMAPRYREAAEQGRIKIIDGDEIYYVLGLKAGALGLPFVPYPPGHEFSSDRSSLILDAAVVDTLIICDFSSNSPPLYHWPPDVLSRPAARGTRRSAGVRGSPLASGGPEPT